MERIINVLQKSYKGRTYPEAINFNSLGLEQHKIKIVPYSPYFERGELKSVRELHFKKWLIELESKGACIPLWKGKYKTTICQKDYANMQVVGALFIPNESILSLFKARHIDRFLRIKAKNMLKDILTVSSNGQPSLLMLLNNVWWTAEVLDYMGRVIFSRSKLSENKATETVNTELNKLKYKWEKLSNEKAKLNCR